MVKLSTGLGGRALWTLAGQTFSSGSNFLLTVFVLSVATPVEFGTFSITLTTFLLIVQLSRALVSVPVLVLYSSPDDSAHGAHWPDSAGVAGRPSTAAALGMGVIAAGVLALAAVVTDSFLVDAAPQFLLLAAATPVLILQDHARHLAFAAGRPAVAAMSDATWIGLQLAGSAVLLVAGDDSVLGLMAVWAVAGAVAWALAALVLRVPPALAGGWAWLRENRALCRRLVGEFVATSGSFYALYYGLALVAGAEELGDLKAAQTLFGPVIVLLLGGISLGVPESVRSRENVTHLRHLALLLSTGLAAASLAMGGLVYALLPVFGPDWFPDAWSSARTLIPVLAVYAAALGASTGPISGLRALGASGWIVRLRAAAGAGVTVAGLLASWAWGAVGTLAALAVVESAVAAKSWAEFHRRTQPTRESPAGSAGR